MCKNKGTEDDQDMCVCRKYVCGCDNEYVCICMYLLYFGNWKGGLPARRIKSTRPMDHTYVGLCVCVCACERWRWGGVRWTHQA